MYMTTEGGIVPVVRDISVLLSLDTFQGMTDEEIQSLIDYHCRCAVEDEDFRLRSDAIAADSQYHRTQLDAVIAQAQSMLQSVRSRELSFITNSSEGTVISNV